MREHKCVYLHMTENQVTAVKPGVYHAFLKTKCQGIAVKIEHKSASARNCIISRAGHAGPTEFSTVWGPMPPGHEQRWKKNTKLWIRVRFVFFIDGIGNVFP